MAKKKQEAVAPAISTIPMADQDSPLVIDLPDGQKLVVGNIAHGTVIEVATWRGTGRPDSRTSRLMLGVSSSAAATAESAPSQSESSAPVESQQSPLKRWIAPLISSLIAKSPQRKRERAVKEIDELLKDGADEVKPVAEGKSSSRVVEALDDSEDIQAWLDQLMSGSGEEFVRESSATPAQSKVKRISSPRKATKKASSRTPKAKRSRSSSRSKGRKSIKSGARNTKKR